MTPLQGHTPADFRSVGAKLFHGAVACDLLELRTHLANLPTDRAGVRLRDVEGLRSTIAREGSIGSIAAGVLGPGSRAVRMILFDKTEKANWSLAWHQDRTICVRERIDIEGYGPWTMKAGMQHVAPPFELLERMITLRVHIDEVTTDNAPLLVAPGSHRMGRIPASAVEDVVRRCGTLSCLAEAGDVWLYATPVLHALAVAVQVNRRRVLQIDFAAEPLPAGLDRLGV